MELTLLLPSLKAIIKSNIVIFFTVENMFCKVKGLFL